MLYGECFALVSPLEGFCHRAVVILDKSQDLAFQVFDGFEIASFDDFTNQDAEPNFDLVQPRSMFGCVVENDAVGRVAQKGSARSFGFQNARFSFHAQVDIQV